MADDITLPSTADGDRIERVVRWVLMCSHLYYDCGVSIIDDADYDALCVEVAEHFDDLDEHHQSLIGDADTIRSTGMDVLLPRSAVYAAYALARELGYEVEERPFEAKYECECCGCGLAPIRG
jgi:hypothetical protein